MEELLSVTWSPPSRQYQPVDMICVRLARIARGNDNKRHMQSLAGACIWRQVIANELMMTRICVRMEHRADDRHLELYEKRQRGENTLSYPPKVLRWSPRISTGCS
eukprot:4976651-Amphidinium_carterae.1